MCFVYGHVAFLFMVSRKQDRVCSTLLLIYLLIVIFIDTYWKMKNGSEIRYECLHIQRKGTLALIPWCAVGGLGGSHPYC